MLTDFVTNVIPDATDEMIRYPRWRKGRPECAYYVRERHFVTHDDEGNFEVTKTQRRLTLMRDVVWC